MYIECVCAYQTCFSLDELEPEPDAGEMEIIDGDEEDDGDDEESEPALGLRGMIMNICSSSMH